MRRARPQKSSNVAVYLSCCAWRVRSGLAAVQDPRWVSGRSQGLHSAVSMNGFHARTHIELLVLSQLLSV